MSKITKLPMPPRGIKLAKFEIESESGIMKVDEEFIRNLRALAKKQKAESSGEEFAKTLGNDGKDVPKPIPEETELNAIADSLEIIEEE